MATVLEIEGRADLNAAAADLNDLGGEARNLAGDIDKAGASARTAGADLSGLGDGSDALASKSSQATGALGALAGGLEAVGLEKYAATLQGASIATDVMSGAGDALNLVAETAAGRWIVTTARTVAHAVAVGAQTVATTAMTVAQGALNVVMSANPIALMVIALAAATAGIILLYKNSETFREIVQKVFDAAGAYVGFYVDAIKKVIEIFGDLPGAARAAWDAVSKAVSDVIDPVKEKVGDLYDGVKNGASAIVGEVSGFFSSMFAPIQTAIGWVQDLIDKISSIDMPDIDLNPLNNRSVFPNGEGGFRPRGTPEFVGVSVEFTATADDKDKAAREMVDALREYFARRGQVMQLTKVQA